MTRPAFITDLLEAAKKATPGPWETCSGNGWNVFGDTENPAHDGDSPLLFKPWENDEANSRYVTLANPKNIRELARYIDELELEIPPP